MQSEYATRSLRLRVSAAGTLFALSLLASPVPAWAGIVETWDDVQEIAAPASVRLGALESNQLIRIFSERKNVTLPTSLGVDISAPSTVPTSSLNLTPGIIPAGTHVNSYLMHFDVVGLPQQAIGTTRLEAVVFDEPVLGIEILSTSLDNTDSLLGAPFTLYPVGEDLRGLELLPGQVGINTFDGITLSADRLRVTVVLSTQLSLDHVRIITQAEVVPEPSTLTLGGLAGIALAGYCAKRRSARRVLTGVGNRS